MLNFIAHSKYSHRQEVSIEEMFSSGFGSLPVSKQDFDLVIEIARSDGLVGGENGTYLHESDDKPGKYVAVGFGLTADGHKTLERLEGQRLLNSNVRQLRDNYLTIVISVITAVAVSWMLYLFGAPQ